MTREQGGRNRDITYQKGFNMKLKIDRMKGRVRRYDAGRVQGSTACFRASGRSTV